MLINIHKTSKAETGTVNSHFSCLQAVLIWALCLPFFSICLIGLKSNISILQHIGLFKRALVWVCRRAFAANLKW